MAPKSSVAFSHACKEDKPHTLCQVHSSVGLKRRLFTADVAMGVRLSTTHALLADAPRAVSA
jgi:hypothetical protein